MDMSRHQGHSHQRRSQSQGLFANISLRSAQIIAGATTIIVFGGLGYALDMLFTALSR
jgi:hypothetical protein